MTPTESVGPNGYYLSPRYFTPTEMARAFNMERIDVLRKCQEHGISIHQGRIDRYAFAAALDEAGKGNKT